MSRKDMIGMAGRRFGRWLVLQFVSTKKLSGGGQKKLWLCRCDCGTERVVSGGLLRTGATTSCGCKNTGGRIDLTGLRFGRWTVLHYKETVNKQPYWSCRCDCGAESAVLGMTLRSGGSRSCGCLRRELNTKRSTIHGQTIGRWEGKGPTPEYIAWRGMISRCYNPKTKRFEDWGGRGITVCDRWRSSFLAFLEDMGRRPSLDHSIDRYPNNDGNYELGNCRWATPKEQASNRRMSKNAVR